MGGSAGRAIWLDPLCDFASRLAAAVRVKRASGRAGGSKSVAQSIGGFGCASGAGNNGDGRFSGAYKLDLPETASACRAEDRARFKGRDLESEVTVGLMERQSAPPPPPPLCALGPDSMNQTWPAPDGTSGRPSWLVCSKFEFEFGL